MMCSNPKASDQTEPLQFAYSLRSPLNLEILNSFHLPVYLAAAVVFAV